MEKQWVYRSVPDFETAAELSKLLNINPSLSTILLQRGIDDFEKARSFFRPSLDHLHDPFLMKNMSQAVNRLSEAISGGEKILVYGDYDVDGTTSVALVYQFLRQFTSAIDYYIPDRYTEGYGLSEKGVRLASQEGFRLIISLDCGIKAMNQARQAKSLGVDLIICDHHLPGAELPDATAILDPKQPGDQYPYKELSGCGVGFKLMQAFCIQNTIPLDRLFQYLDLVAVSIASDIVPITGENRILAYYGLRKLNSIPSPGLASLIEVSGLKPPLSISDVVFYIGPRINATGRLTHARESVKLLISEAEEETLRFAEHLNVKNSERKNYDQSITAEALEMIAEAADIAPKSTVLFKRDWHKGIIGIVASRCIEKFYRPTIILTESNNMATGSARSVDGFDIYEAISACGGLLERYGGHKHAAGLTLSLENVEAFRQKFEEVVCSMILPEQLQPKLEVDLEVDLDFITFKSLKIIDQMAPFGPCNNEPVFSTSGLRLHNDPRVIKEQHLKLFVSQNNNRVMEAIGFGMADKLEIVQSGQPFSMAYHIGTNEYLGNKSLQLNIKDIKID